MGQYQIKIRRSPELIKIGPTSALIHKKSSLVWNEAISAFIIAVAFEVSKHQDTGMSLASLFATARKVHAETNLPPLDPKVSFRQGLTYVSGVYNKSRIRSASVGERLGEKSARISYGTSRVPVFKFTFEIKIFQYLIHEFGYQTAAWYSLEKGRAAMRFYLMNHARDSFPNLGSLFSVGGFGVISNPNR